MGLLSHGVVPASFAVLTYKKSTLRGLSRLRLALGAKSLILLRGKYRKWLRLRPVDGVRVTKCVRYASPWTGDMAVLGGTGAAMGKPINSRAYQKRVTQLLKKAKAVAKQYRSLTGRPLGVTGEVAEAAAVEALGLELAPVRQHGFDAWRRRGGKLDRLQIKARCILDPSKPGGRTPSIKLNKGWDAVLLVLLDENLELTEIHEASRATVRRFLMKPGSRSRNERGQMGVSQFKRIGTKVWPRKSRTRRG